MSNLEKLVFLKLGGSLITDKHRPLTPRKEVIQRLVQEIVRARSADPSLKILLGHGSGSFGHHSAQRYGTFRGVSTPGEWLGFAEVGRDAAALNTLVLEALLEERIPALAFPPSGGVIARGRRILTWDLEPLLLCLEKGMLPVVYGDVVIDQELGGTILSTEMLFSFLGKILQPSRILIAGIEPGVWEDYPDCTRVLDEITPDRLSSQPPALLTSEAVDVTGGMLSKVREMISLVNVVPELRVSIFSGMEDNAVRDALLGKHVGTLIHAPSSSR